jgi:hypothetical protein
MLESWYGYTLLDICTRLRWVVSFTPRPLYSRSKSCRYALDKKLGEIQSRSGRFGEEKSIYPAGNKLIRERVMFILTQFSFDWCYVTRQADKEESNFHIHSVFSTDVMLPKKARVFQSLRIESIVLTNLNDTNITFEIRFSLLRIY